MHDLCFFLRSRGEVFSWSIVEVRRDARKMIVKTALVAHQRNKVVDIWMQHIDDEK